MYVVAGEVRTSTEAEQETYPPLERVEHPITKFAESTMLDKINLLTGL
jgi:hypothetical protein